MLVIECVLDVSKDAGSLPHASLTQEHDLKVVVLSLAHPEELEKATKSKKRGQRATDLQEQGHIPFLQVVKHEAAG